MPARTSVIASTRIPCVRPFFSLSLILILLVSVADTSFAQRRNERQLRKREVSEVTVEGNKSISTNVLSEWITTRHASWFERALNKISSSWGRPRQFVDEAIIMSDTESLSDYYHAKGFLEVRVGFRFDENQADVAEWNRIRDLNRFLPPAEQEEYPFIQTKVVFLVTEGPAYKVAGFTFEGMETLPFDLLERVTADLGISRGSQYDAEAVIKEDERVRELLGENGYPFFHRDSIIVESIAGTTTVGITVYFETGHRYRMGDLRIVYDTLGAEGRVKESTIRRQIPYEKGAWVKLSTLREGERNLYQLGTFDLAIIYPDTAAASGLPDSLKDGQEVPLVVELRTRTTVDIAPGIFAAVAQSGKVAGGVTAAYNHRNLFSGAEKFEVHGSFQPLPTSQFRWDLGTSLEFPYIAGINIPLQIASNLSHLEEKNRFLEKTYSGQVGIRKNIPTINTTARGSIAIEYLRRGIFDPDLQNLDLPDKEQFNLIGALSGVYDITNDFLNPSEGLNASAGIEVGIPVLNQIFREDLPSAKYYKPTLQARQFFDLDGIGKSILALRGTWGKVYLGDPGNPASDIPIIRRFTIGGPSSLRGWPSSVLLMAQDTVGVSSLSRGYQMIEMNVEWRVAPFRYEDAFSFFEKLLSDIRLGVFADWGNLWYKDTPIELKNFALAGGIGLRYDTFLGAIRLDWGLKLFDPAPGLKETFDKEEEAPNATPISTPGLWLWERTWNFGDCSEIQFSLGLPF